MRRTRRSMSPSVSAPTVLRMIPLIVLGAFLELIFCSPPPIAAVFLGLAVALDPSSTL